MISYPLRNMDDDLWYAAKAKAATDRLSVRDIIVLGLQLYVAQGLGAFAESVEAAPDGRHHAPEGGIAMIPVEFKGRRQRRGAERPKEGRTRKMTKIYAIDKTTGDYVCREVGRQYGDGQCDHDDSPVWLLVDRADVIADGIDPDTLPEVEVESGEDPRLAATDELRKKGPVMAEQPNRYDDINERLDTRDEQFAQAHREEDRAHRAVMADIRRLLREMGERERLADERWEEVHAMNVALRDELKKRNA